MTTYNDPLIIPDQTEIPRNKFVYMIGKEVITTVQSQEWWTLENIADYKTFMAHQRDKYSLLGRSDMLNFIDDEIDRMNSWENYINDNLDLLGIHDPEE